MSAPVTSPVTSCLLMVRLPMHGICYVRYAVAHHVVVTDDHDLHVLHFLKDVTWHLKEARHTEEIVRRSQRNCIIFIMGAIFNKRWLLFICVE